LEISKVLRWFKQERVMNKQSYCLQATLYQTRIFFDFENYNQIAKQAFKPRC